MAKKKGEHSRKTVALTLALAAPAMLVSGAGAAAVPTNPDREQVNVQREGTPVLSESSKIRLAANSKKPVKASKKAPPRNK